MPVTISAPTDEDAERVARIIGDAMEGAGYPREVSRVPVFRTCRKKGAV